MIPYKQIQVLETPHFRIGLWQEPTRICISAGVDISEQGWRHPLFHIRFLIWEIDLEIDYSDPEKPSEFSALMSMLNEGQNSGEKTI